MRRLVRRCESERQVDCSFLRDLTGRVCGPSPPPAAPAAVLPFHCMEVPWDMVQALDPM